MSTFRTYGFLESKVEEDLDLQDETFIQPDEMVGYGNEAIKEIFGEILGLHKNYYLSKWFVPCIGGNDLFNLPPNIYANKIRGIVYQNGSIIYTMKQMRIDKIFENIALIDQFGLFDWYYYLLRNDVPGQPQVQIVPPVRSLDNFICPPLPNAKTVMVLYYIREANRIPLTGEYYFTETVIPSQVAGNVMTVSAGTGFQRTVNTATQPPGTAYWPYVTSPIPYVTGDQVILNPNFYVAGSTVPGGLNPGQTYWVIAVDTTHIMFASSYQNAIAGNALTLTSGGFGLYNLSVAGTAAIQQATLLDIPEAYEFIMQWMKVRCVEKEGDPRYEAMVAELQSQRKMAVDSLTEMIEDDDTEIQGDFSSYLEMS